MGEVARIVEVVSNAHFVLNMSHGADQAVKGMEHTYVQNMMC